MVDLQPQPTRRRVDVGHRVVRARGHRLGAELGLQHGQQRAQASVVGGLHHRDPLRGIENGDLR